MNFKVVAAFFCACLVTTAAIDTATRERIREALQAGGQEGEVLFIDGSEFEVDSNHQAHGRHEVRIVSKEVDVTN